MNDVTEATTEKTQLHNPFKVVCAVLVNGDQLVAQMSVPDVDDSSTSAHSYLHLIQPLAVDRINGAVVLVKYMPYAKLDSVVIDSGKVVHVNVVTDQIEEYYYASLEYYEKILKRAFVDEVSVGISFIRKMIDLAEQTEKISAEDIVRALGGIADQEITEGEQPATEEELKRKEEKKKEIEDLVLKIMPGSKTIN